MLSQVIADAFHDLAPSRWLIPDPDARRQIFPGYFRLYVEHALARGIVHTTPGGTAAALWIPAGEDAAGPPDGYDARLAAVTGSWASRFRAFDVALDRHHPAGTAHWHLAILAVRPDRQGRGTGSALLAARHAVLDQVPGTPAYLEASSPRARDLYLAHGYALRPGAPFHLPGDGPPLWPMWRPPGTRTGATTEIAARRPRLQPGNGGDCGGGRRRPRPGHHDEQEGRGDGGRGGGRRAARDLRDGPGARGAGAGPDLG